MDLSEDFWTKRYQEGQIQWDCGEITSPLRDYIDSINDKNISILIPGSGNGYEAEYLHNKGFRNVFVADLSQNPLKNLKARVPDFPIDHLLHTDFFSINQRFDLILEQTFFCALDPSLRSSYVAKSFEILNTGGVIAGVLFNVPLNDTEPPFGGDKAVYQPLFETKFTIKTMDDCYNSIPARMGMELFIELVKKASNQ